jgi:hypothetical protein
MGREEQEPETYIQRLIEPQPLERRARIQTHNAPDSPMTPPKKRIQGRRSKTRERRDDLQALEKVEGDAEACCEWWW